MTRFTLIFVFLGISMPVFGMEPKLKLCLDKADMAVDVDVQDNEKMECLGERTKDHEERNILPRLPTSDCLEAVDSVSFAHQNLARIECLDVETHKQCLEIANKMDKQYYR